MSGSATMVPQPSLDSGLESSRYIAANQLRVMTDKSAMTLMSLPPELVGRVMEHLLPGGSLIKTPGGEKRHLNPVFVDSRTSLSAVCRTSRLLHTITTRHLYQVVVLKDQRELFCFFRTLAATPDLRPLVRSFAWHGRLPASSPEDMSQLSSTYLPSCWPASELDHSIARLMDLDKRSISRGWSVLGAVLGLIPKVKKLYIRLSKPAYRPPHPPSLDTFLPPECISFLRLLDPNTQPSGGRHTQTGPTEPSLPHAAAGSAFPRLFLWELEIIIVQPYQGPRSNNKTDHILRQTLLHCPSLRRIEEMGWANWEDVLRRGVYWGQKSVTPVVAENIKEVLGRRLLSPQYLPCLTAAFPRLTMLSIEFGDGSDPNTAHPYQLSQALLCLRQTLQTLHLTTTPGHSSHGFEFPPLLTPILRDMQALKHLTTESIWLFERQNASTTLELAHLLPSSLVDFHLIDYWGVSAPATFYQLGPVALTPIECIEQLVSNLHHSCTTHLSNLRHVKFTSPCFLGGSAFGRELGEPSIITASIHRYRQLFAKTGVHFSSAAPDDWRSQVRQLWTSIV